MRVLGQLCIRTRRLGLAIVQACEHINAAASLACAHAAITSEAVCTGASVGGTWSGASCALGTQPLCEAAGGIWHPVKLWSLKNGADLIIVGLLQGILCVSAPSTLHASACTGFHCFADPYGPDCTPDICFNTHESTQHGCTGGKGIPMSTRL